ncbi:hypothetical protein HOK51_09200 [Candidatus Woesearchaeota archaeon]|jgi:hypothetical protein|nr:hypothetical protein [Candidatus Woesearchaeota archaeon]MBT6520006.1 hypothetical protein [Candidatus Woesearchaeota archaeon]MBT7367747.1 hypothetical protein [Candidatus Woesearchaeota archaeon]
MEHIVYKKSEPLFIDFVEELKEREKWEFYNFHTKVGANKDFIFLGRNSPLDFRNGTANYQYKDAKINHWQEFEPEYSIVEVKVLSEDVTLASEVENLIKRIVE